MTIRWENLPSRTLWLPVSVAVLVAVVLMNEFELSRLWAVPVGLWVGVQVQYRMNRNEQQEPRKKE